MSDDPRTQSLRLQELVAAAAGGGRQACDELLRHYWPLVCRVVRSRKARVGRGLGLREQTCDLAQQAALRLLRELPKHQWRGQSALAAWIAKLASAEVIDVHRYHGAQRRAPAAEVDDQSVDALERKTRSPESKADRRNQVEALEEALAQLKPDYEAALRLHAMGFTHAEVGELLGCTAEAARKLEARGLSRLQQLRAR